MNDRFWETLDLAQMSERQWEAICDGCGRCCLIKLEDEADGTVYYTDIACRLLDLASCRCLDYANRQGRVPACIKLSPQNLGELWQMPPSCSYRRLAEGRGLPEWHHLLTGDQETVHQAGFSVRGLAGSESEVHDNEELEDRLVDWPVLDQPASRGRRRS